VVEVKQGQGQGWRFEKGHWLFAIVRWSGCGGGLDWSFSSAAWYLPTSR
jgi:hypothetical protein